jgi:adenosylcobinamide-phosphate synthase
LSLIPISAVILALFFDFLFGDPKNKYHPTVWIGKLIGKFVPNARSTNQFVEKINGIILLLSIVTIVSILVI